MPRALGGGNEPGAPLQGSQTPGGVAGEGGAVSDPGGPYGAGLAAGAPPSHPEMVEARNTGGL